MLRNEIEKRIRNLEQGLDQFSGIDWVIKVGEIAEIKGAVLDMTDESEASCTSNLTAAHLQTLDLDISAALRPAGPADSRLAFQKAYGTLRTWLTPALPGKRKTA